MKITPGNEPGEDFNVRVVHGQLLREQAEPGELLRATPWWLKHLVYAPLIIWGLWYLFAASGGFRWDEFSEGAVSSRMRLDAIPETALEPAPPPPPVTAAAPDGEKIYQAVCLVCHQASGTGLPGAFPPLAGSDWVSGDERRLALIVLHGLMGPIEVNGQPWNGVMPPQGQSLSDVQIASVLSYIRSAWGNSAPPLSPETVASLRNQFPSHAPWTVQDLENALP